MKGFGDLYKSTKKSNKKTKFSLEKIINYAIQSHLKGNIPEAKKYYQKLISQGCNDHRVFCNYGVILQGQGKSQETEKYFRKAIEINPNFADAHSNLGNILRDLGKFKEAELSIRKAIELNPDFAMAHSNLGSILHDHGNLKEAELSTRKAIDLNPNFADAHSNLGNILKDLGKLKEAELFTRKAIDLNPNFADAHSNLGNILKDLGKLKEAELFTRKAIELNPDFAIAHFNLGSILRDLGKLDESFDSYCQVIEINPGDSNIYPVITRFLKGSDPSKLNKSKLIKILNILLERNDIPHKELFNAFNFVYRNQIISSLEKSDLEFSNIQLLSNNKVILNALKKIIFADPKLEAILTKARRNICDRIAKDIETINYSEILFIAALGEQCFVNEYIYSLTNEEKISINKIKNKIMDGEINEINISILSCYFPLYKLLDQIPSLKSFTSTNQSLLELIELQINEPLKEIELSQNIKKLGLIKDDISQKVKSQYEKNPYPRWRYAHHSESRKISIVQGINNQIKPNIISSSSAGNNQLQILVAGCGTGNQILNTLSYKNSHVTAIDLSLSSLAYAQRKINELGIDNVELIEMDILEVYLLKKKFDIIFCSGVLHHMDDPSAGLKSLLGVLKDNCFMKLGLYSELARKDIVKSRNYIKSQKLQSNEDGIRNFRETIISEKLPVLNSLTQSSDFYSLSSCRDLCFHEQEHRFTIKELQEILKSNELKFLGFVLRKTVKSLYYQFFPEDKEQTNLENWVRFEEKHPMTFKGMYQFWVSKL